MRAALALCVAAVLVGGLPVSASAAPGDTVTVKDGSLRGKVTGDGRQFLGVPYAAPPTGNLRFRPPKPAVPWSGVRDATKAGNICPQIGLGNEDCLVLNVHTPPAAESKNLPVMVWIPGGAYSLGWASGYDPAPLVAKGKVIVVTVNYRLGPLGYMALPGLAEESGTTGNYGLLDQQAGLRWVRDNIGAFGGDPRNVTLFGESAGGHSVCMQLISPRAAGLFHKAISESGGCVGTALGPVPAERAYTTGTEFAKKVGCTDPGTMVACLRDKPAGDLRTDAGGLFGTGGLSWVPVIDGSVVEEPTRPALESGRYHRVPLISGSNKHEGRLFLALGHHLAKLRRANADELKTELRFRAGKLTQELLDAYPAESADNADVALSSATTDGGFSCPALFTDRAAAANPGQKVYAYEFSDPDPPLAGLDPFLHMGAYHSAEIWYLFKSLNGIPLFPGLNADQQRLSDQMISYWSTFAKTGDPNGPGVPQWPAFTSRSQQLQRLTSAGTGPFSTFDTDHKCRLWDR
ncbi:carboxylesterase/lipase family protein [Actinomadura rudentiformis]|nr:carboxylesterase/lipase family protein [Actinomadura rudentiformis]